jgi:hypothetical protein
MIKKTLTLKLMSYCFLQMIQNKTGRDKTYISTDTRRLRFMTVSIHI